MVRSMSRWLPLLALLVMSGCTSLPDSARGRFEARAVKVEGETAYYQVFIPAGVQAAAPTHLPVILFLHGSGERGADGVKQTYAGLGLTCASIPTSPPWWCSHRYRAMRNGAAATTVRQWPHWTPRSPNSAPTRHGST